MVGLTKAESHVVTIMNRECKVDDIDEGFLVIR